MHIVCVRQCCVSLAPPFKTNMFIEDSVELCIIECGTELGGDIARVYI